MEKPTVFIDKERPVVINGGALFDLAEFGLSLEGLKDDAKAFKALCVFVWSGLEDRRLFPDPRSVARQIADLERFAETAGDAVAKGLGELKQQPENSTDSGESPGDSE